MIQLATFVRYSVVRTAFALLPCPTYQEAAKTIPIHRLFDHTEYHTLHSCGVLELAICRF